MHCSLLPKSTMEMLEQEVPAAYSQMLQMFPNIPQHIILKYVLQYPSDVEKCAQMLTNVNCSGLPLTAMENSTNINEDNSAQPNHLILNPTLFDNNNIMIMNDECNEQTSYDSHSSYSASIVSPSIVEQSTFTNSSKNPCLAVNFNEPLILDIIPDDEEISHSWRPSNSDDMLCTNIFVPSPVTENFQLPNYQTPNWNSQQNHVEFHLNQRTANVESSKYSLTAQMLYNYPLPEWGSSSKDTASYLNYQKSQMNAVRYEVIKAKIELSDIKENVENLEKELKEKMESKSVQDIIDLNKEIEQLRLECQCLCSEIDDIDTEKQIILGDVNQRFCIVDKSSEKNEDAHGVTSSCFINSNQAACSDIPVESKTWQCPNCTFGNHPAIKVCEMCQLPKSVPRRSSFLPTSSDSCYCHPRESILPVNT